MATTITSSCLGILIAVMMIITVVVVPLPATAATVDRKSPPPPRSRYISYWALFHNLHCNERDNGLEPCMAYVAGKVGHVVPARCCHAAKSFFYGVATSYKRYKRCMCWERFPHTSPKLGEALVERIPAGCGFRVPKDITSPANCPQQ